MGEPPTGGVVDGRRVRPGDDLEGGAGGQRPGDHRQAADVGERQAGEPTDVGADPGGGGGDERGVLDRGVRQDRPLRGARRTGRGHDQGVAGLYRFPAGQPVSVSVRIDDPTRSLGAQHRGGVVPGCPTIERQRGVAVVPDPLERVDEPWSAVQIESHQFRHAEKCAASARPGAHQHGLPR